MKFDTIFKPDKSKVDILISKIRNLPKGSVESMKKNIEIFKILDKYHSFWYKTSKEIGKKYCEYYNSFPYLEGTSAKSVEGWRNIVKYWDDLLEIDNFHTELKQFDLNISKNWSYYFSTSLSQLNDLKLVNYTEYYFYSPDAVSIYSTDRNDGDLLVKDIKEEMDKFFVQYKNAKKKYILAVDFLSKALNI